jgi:hypothetical protein
LKKISIKSLLIFLEKAQAVVQKTSRKNVTSTIFSLFSVSLMDIMGGKITINLEELHTLQGRTRRNTCTPEKS